MFKLVGRGFGVWGLGKRRGAVTLSTNLMGVPKQPLKKLEMLYELTKSISVQLRTMLSTHQVRYDSDSGTRINWADTHSAVAPRGSLPKGGIQQLKTMSAGWLTQPFIASRCRQRPAANDGPRVAALRKLVRFRCCVRGDDPVRTIGERW